MRPLALCAALLATLTTSCSDPIEPPSRVDGVRVLAVKATPALAAPGERVSLEMLVADGQSRPLQIAWFGGCDDPAGDEPSSCFAPLTASIHALDDTALSAGATVPGQVGAGVSFSYEMPADIISRRAPPPGGQPPYGLSYVFFAACAGTLQKAPLEGAPHGLGIRCVDGAGAELGSRELVVGYLPLKAYEGVRNAAPTLQSVTVSGRASLSAACKADGDCSAGEVCGAKGVCLPVVSPCDDDDCEGTPVGAIVSDSSVETDLSTLPPALETVWVSFFADRGKFGDDARLFAEPDGNVRPVSTLTSPLKPTAGFRGEMRVWVVVHDNRVGVDYRELSVMVR